MKEEVNKFYSVRSKDSQSFSIYDIRDLGEKTWRGFEIGFIDSFGNMTGGNSISTLTTADDYDEEFYKKLTEIRPAYNVSDFLDYHSQKYQERNKQKSLFLKHIQYVIVPKLNRFYKKEYLDITNDWITKNNKIMLKKQLEEKNNFLKRAYENAIEYAPSSPLSVTIKPIEFGKSIGYDMDTTRRIVNELVDDNYLTSTLGMGMIMITKNGLNYLREVEMQNTAIPNFNINVGNNSNVQFQQGNINSTQNLYIDKNEKEEYEKFSNEIKNNFDLITNYLDSNSKEDLDIEIQYLDKNLNRRNPKKELVKNIVSNVFDILKSVPANIIANIITAQVPI